MLLNISLIGSIIAVNILVTVASLLRLRAQAPVTTGELFIHSVSMNGKMQILDQQGNRLYLNGEEREAFRKAALLAERRVISRRV
jgi:hypothetical protein